jgi:hypothetical protein
VIAVAAAEEAEPGWTEARIFPEQDPGTGRWLAVLRVGDDPAARAPMSGPVYDSREAAGEAIREWHRRFTAGLAAESEPGG